MENSSEKQKKDDWDYVRKENMKLVFTTKLNLTLVWAYILKWVISIAQQLNPVDVKVINKHEANIYVN